MQLAPVRVSRRGVVSARRQRVPALPRALALLGALPLALMWCIAAPSGAAARPAAPRIAVEIEYLAPHGVARIDAAGAHYIVGPRQVLRGTVTYPQAYWRADYPLYTPGRPLTYRLRVRNLGRAPLRGVEVAAVLEYLNYFGKDGDDLPGDSRRSWAVPALAAGGVWQVEASVVLPRQLDPGLQQTHVTVRQAGGRTARQLIDQPQAGLYCPREPAAVTAERSVPRRRVRG